MKSFGSGFVVAILLLVGAAGLGAQALRNTITFDNQSGEPTLAPVVLPVDPVLGDTPSSRTRIAAAPEPFVIKDETFIDRSIPDGFASDIEIEELRKPILQERKQWITIENRGEWILGVSKGSVEIYSGRFAFFGHGSKHTWIGKSSLYSYTFDSDKDDPLQFRVDREKGYVYVRGKGTITMPDGKMIRLP